MNTSEKIILTVLVVFAMLVYFMPLAAGIYLEKQEQRKRGELDHSKAKYDERQKLIRLKASEHALYALGGYLLLWMVLGFDGVLHGEEWTATLLMAGLMLAIVVWSSECILRGAMLGFNQGKKESGQIILYIAMGACWTVMGGTDLESRSDIPIAAAKLLLGVSYMLQGSLMLYARHRRKLTESQIDAGDGEP